MDGSLDSVTSVAADHEGCSVGESGKELKTVEDQKTLSLICGFKFAKEEKLQRAILDMDSKVAY